MTLIETMIPSLPDDTRLAQYHHSVGEDRFRIMNEGAFMASPDVICIRTGERDTDAVQTPAARI